MGFVAKSRAVVLLLIIAVSAIVFDTATTHKKAQSAGCDAFVVYSYDYAKGTGRQSVCLMNGQTFSPPAHYLQPVVIAEITGPGMMAVAQISRFGYNEVHDYYTMGFAEEYAMGTSRTYPLNGTIQGATFLNSIVVHKDCAAMVNSTYTLNGPISSICVTPGKTTIMPKAFGMSPYLLDVFVASPKTSCQVRANIQDFTMSNYKNASTMTAYPQRSIYVTTASSLSKQNGMFWTQLNVTRGYLQGVYLNSFSTAGPC